MPFWWLDNSDISLARQKLRAVMERQLKEWERVRFQEDDFSSPAEAYRELMAYVSMRPILHPGRLIYMYGIPSFQDKLAKSLDEICNKVLLVIVARPDGACSLYKRARESKRKGFTVEEAFNLSRETAVEWTKARAMEFFGREIDNQACMMLIDAVGLDPNKITHEIDKMRNLCEGKIAGWVVEQSAYGTGDADVRKFCSCLLENKAEHAHEMSRRLMAREEPLKFLGLPADWSRRLLIASSCKILDKATENAVQLVKKRGPKGEEKEREVTAKHQRVMEASPAELASIIKEKEGRGEVVPMFPNPKSLFYTFKELARAGREEEWVRRLSKGIGELQVAARIRKEEFQKLVEDFVSRMTRRST
jgi:hypothetical protein